MGKWGVCEEGWRKGPWTPQEDNLLIEYVTQYGEGRWSSVAKCTGLQRSGKSSRLRWVNYLRPGLKKGQLSPQEQGIIIELHAIWGNKWSTIARYLPGRTDNEIKNYWRTHFKKRMTTNLKKRENASLKESAEFPEKVLLADAATSTDDDPRNNEDMQETGTRMYQPDMIDVGNHQMLPVFYEDNCYSIGMWSDFTPQDCYTWDGLWN